VVCNRIKLVLNFSRSSLYITLLKKYLYDKYRTSSFSRDDGLSILVLNVLMKTRFLNYRNFSLLHHPEEFGDVPSLVSSDETVSRGWTRFYKFAKLIGCLGNWNSSSRKFFFACLCVTLLLLYIYYSIILYTPHCISDVSDHHFKLLLPIYYHFIILSYCAITV